VERPHDRHPWPRDSTRANSVRADSLERELHALGQRAPPTAACRDRHRLDRGGDRQLNHALHIIAITRARHDPATKAYLARTQAEGKGKKGALRCLSGTPHGRFHHLLSLPARTPQRDPGNAAVHAATAPPRRDTLIIDAAPALMPCIG
jgi:hypothetical protein